MQVNTSIDLFKIYLTNQIINYNNINVSSIYRKRIFENTSPNQHLNQFQLPTQKQPQLSINSLKIDPELSYIAHVGIEQQKSTSQIEGQVKSEIKNEQISQKDPAKQTLLKEVQLDNLENIFTLFRSKVQMNQSNFQTSRLMILNQEPQYYQQLEIDAEGLRDRIKMEARTQNQIIKVNVIQQLKNIQTTLISFDSCTSYSKFQREIKYAFNQFESKADELRDLFNEAFNFMSVVSVVAFERLHKPFDESEIISKAEFTSISLKHFSDIELIAKQYEQTLSEKRRLGNINQNHQQYKSFFSKLLQLIKSYPQQELEFQQKMINLQRVSSIYFKRFQKISKYVQQTTRSLLKIIGYRQLQSIKLLFTRIYYKNIMIAMIIINFLFFIQINNLKITQITIINLNTKKMNLNLHMIIVKMSQEDGSKNE